jgi:hypothetical protein
MGPLDLCPAVNDGEASSGDRLWPGGSWPGSPSTILKPQHVRVITLVGCVSLSGAKNQHMITWNLSVGPALMAP